MSKLNKKQDLAVKRFKRALKALYDADVLICGIDNDIIYATRDLCEKAEEEWTREKYPSPAMAHRIGQEEGNYEGHDLISSSCYRGSGGW